MFNRKDIILFHDNARPRSTLRTRQIVAEVGWEILSHPHYSSDLAPSVYHFSIITRIIVSMLQVLTFSCIVAQKY